MMTGDLQLNRLNHGVGYDRQNRPSNIYVADTITSPSGRHSSSTCGGGLQETINQTQTTHDKNNHEKGQTS